MASLKPVLTPVAQRLVLYRFAIVEVQPDHPIIPLGWGLPYLQALPTQRAWDRFLRFCAPFNALSQGPVISPSLAVLRKLRQHQPTRPLILVRPAHDTPVAPWLSRQLVRAYHPAASLTPADDAIDPLLWMTPCKPIPAFDMVAYHDKGAHPLIRLSGLMRKWNPQSSIYFREDGVPQEQLWLFANYHQRDVPPKLTANIHSWAHKLKTRLQALEIHHYVFAKDLERLNWFRRDVLRTLPPKFRCVDFPYQPDPRDPSIVFVCTRDAQIKLLNLAPLPSIHLDGDPRTLAYREARMQQGRPHWLSRCAPVCTARYPAPEGVMRFQGDASGWRSFPGGPEVNDQSQAFHNRAEILRLLYDKPGQSLCRDDRTNAPKSHCSLHV